MLRVFTWPGSPRRGADDRLTEAASALIYEPSEARDRITGRVFEGCNRDGVQLLNECYAKVVEMAPVMKRLRDARKTPQEALKAGLLSEAELAGIEVMQALVDEVVAVDDFTPEALSLLFPNRDKARARRTNRRSVG
ncbi:acyl-CoA dehydrogenase domain-containing protein [Ponticoccus litoralis]|uniref:Acyl-CoA dehydrogenase domain-containing protein n=1 Tax=Ponticoccus litoralis TaxID=422297 RepID=A0AAW9S4I9_9RHOB